MRAGALGLDRAVSHWFAEGTAAVLLQQEVLFAIGRSPDFALGCAAEVPLLLFWP